jgi:hypothetical protein
MEKPGLEGIEAQKRERDKNLARVYDEFKQAQDAYLEAVSSYASLIKDTDVKDPDTLSKAHIKFLAAKSKAAESGIKLAKFMFETSNDKINQSK